MDWRTTFTGLSWQAGPERRGSLIDFSPTPEQTALVETIRRFGQRELAPRYAYWDQSGEFPRELWRRMGELGLCGLRISPEWGGLGVDALTTGLCIEEVARWDFNCATTVLVPALTGEILEHFATPATKESWLAPMSRGAKVVAISLTEPDAGTDAASLRATARPDGDEFVLNGEKSATTLMMAADASIVFARTGGGGARGVSAFLVPMDLPGITRTPYRDMGSRASVRGSLFLDDVRIPAGNLLGLGGQGFYQVMKGFDLSRALIGLQCLGAARQSLDETMNYVRERQAFGRHLASFQGVAFPIAEHAARIESTRWLCLRALWLRDQGLPHTAEAAMAKWLGPKTAVEAIHECLLLHGHYGYTQELPLEQRLRDVIGLEIGDGTAQVSKLVIARELLGKEFKPL